MNARTSRLLARVAHAHWLRDPRDPRQPEGQVLANLKEAWNATPRPKREEARKGLVALFNTLIGDRRV